MSGELGFIAAAAQYGLGSILVKPRRSIGALVMQVVVEETHHDELEITEHPVEQGASISDHSYMRPSEVVIRGGWSDSPSISSLFAGVVGGIASTVSGVQSLVTGNNASSARDMYEKLLKLQAAREPFDVYTGKRVYKNMLVKSINTTTDAEHENSFFVTATLRQVLIVATQVLTVSAPMANQANPSATAQPVNSGAKALTPSTRFQAP